EVSTETRDYNTRRPYGPVWIPYSLHASKRSLPRQAAARKSAGPTVFSWKPTPATSLEAENSAPARPTGTSATRLPWRWANRNLKGYGATYGLKTTGGGLCASPTHQA